MKFKVLQENLRKILWDRIEAGELTGLRLAEQTGFKQAHISNFFNRKRGLSLKLDAHDGLAMHPRLAPGATLLIDRHYTSLRPYRNGELNMYAVLKNDNCLVRYVELAENDLILRPYHRGRAAL